MAEDKRKELDPLYVDKKQPSMEEVEADGGLHVANAEDSKVNVLESMSYEDHQQVFGQNVRSEDMPDDGENYDAAGPAENVKEDLKED